MSSQDPTPIDKAFSECASRERAKRAIDDAIGTDPDLHFRAFYRLAEALGNLILYANKKEDLELIVLTIEVRQQILDAAKELSSVTSELAKQAQVNLKLCDRIRQLESEVNRGTNNA